MSDPTDTPPVDGTVPGPGTTSAAVSAAAVEATVAPVPAAKPERPRFIDDLRAAYNLKGKAVVAVTGNTHDYFYSPKLGHFVDFEPVVYQEFGDKFTVMRLDIANGLSLFTN